MDALLIKKLNLGSQILFFYQHIYYEAGKYVSNIFHFQMIYKY